MAEKKKKKEKNSGRKGTDDGVDSNKLTKDEDSLARFLRFNCPTNSTMFEGNEVHYFSGRKAIDVLVESKKYGAMAKSPKFLNSDAAEEFLQTLLAKGLFFRAKKLVPKKKEKPSSDQQQKGEKSGRDVSKSPPNSAKAEKRQRKEAEEGSKTEEKGEEDEAREEEEEEEDQQQEKPEANTKDEEKRRKKKVKLLFHDIQTLDVSTSDVYVWVFDPTPLWKKCVGILIVLGTIGGCLFPLWPDWLRLGIYYLSVIGIALFGLLLGVAFARTILFGLIWLFTLGRHRLWLLPNLLEECGFFESFQPAYTYEHVPGGVFAKKEPKNKKKKGVEAKKDGQKKGEEGQQQQQKDSENRGEKTTEGRDEDEKTPLLKQEKSEEDSESVSPPPTVPLVPLPNEENKTGETAQMADKAQNEGERNCSSRSESRSSSKKDGTSGSEGDDAEEGTQTGTDDSNSWEKLSENSHRSGECGKKTL
ncbi:hypothetical protein niasHT_020588 [Heterodera trifolii]|uniref:Translocation protein SEC62 n=1 Tax=Heterodera trifolii TaxID=157864 RepID=A0ABD2JNC3_9BILA